MAFLPYARATGASRARPFAQDLSSVSIAVAGLAGIAPLILLGAPTLGGAGAAGVIGGIWGLYSRRRLGGYTGDSLGAGQQLMELGFYLGAIVEFPRPALY
jgi:adenosylcobinamide-GDP ribazoletransferase